METIKQKNKLLLSHKVRMSIDSAIASGAGTLILLSILADMLHLWWGIGIPSIIVVAVAIIGWQITQRIATEKEYESIR